jgi:CheY-like chemotaxis protein
MDTPRRVLVIDDNVDSAEMLAEFMTMKGHDVRMALTGPEALLVFDRFRPDVVLLDIGLPGMNGYEVAQRIRELPSGGRTLLVALTGFGQSADRDRTAQAGFDIHLVKPVEPEAISRLVAAGRTEPVV